MRKAITAVACEVEIATYDDDNRLALRPQPQRIVALEVDIPPAVQEWLWGMLPKSGG